ncbi:MAG: sigma-70 family RNA polymerase sigma factor [Ruminococcus sp.]|nr:sigma-70 family RNA polymerase sigma factor [Ruminococcus sp.]
MKYVFNKLKMEIILKLIEERDYYYIQTEKLYDHFIGPGRIVITNDLDFAKKHPRLAKMIIMTPGGFEPMIAIYSEWLGNERLADDRQRRHHNDEGYYEDCDTDEEGNGDFLRIRDLPLNPVADEVESRERAALVREALLTLTETQLRRTKMHFYDGLTEREIGAIEGVSYKQVRKSIEQSKKKIRFFLENRGLKTPFNCS